MIADLTLEGFETLRGLLKQKSLLFLESLIFVAGTGLEPVTFGL